MTHPDEFSQIQMRYFEAADERRFFHQTAHPYYSMTERTLLDGVQPQAGQRLLEVGCGEGGNLFLLRPGETQCIGIDLFWNKLIFAKNHLPRCRFICSNADRLPFSDESFDLVLCRDVLHHLPAKEPTLREISRVCRPGGKIVIIEPNGRNPVMRVQPLLVRAEAGIRQNSPRVLQQLFSREIGPFPATLRFKQPLPLFRMILHYRYGFPQLGRWRGVHKLFDAMNLLASKLVPESRWAYLVFEIEKK